MTQRLLREYFLFQLKDLNKLYECCVFLRILQGFAREFDLSLREVQRDSTRAVTFTFKQDPKLKIVYHKQSTTGWLVDGKPYFLT